jgi:uncharacterized protein YkwD
VTRALSLMLSAASLTALVAAPSAVAAIGLEGQQVAAPTKRPASAGPLIAPLKACPGQDDLGLPADAQEQAMRCMTDFARGRAGLTSLGEADALDASARAKAGDIFSCDSFSHFACGRQFTYWMEETGYIAASCWRVGENLAWGTGEHGTVRSIFQAWMRSPGHRRNILGNYSQLGVSVGVGELGGRPGTRVWAQHFGSHCESTS